MDHICVALPILDGKVDAAKAFMRDLEQERKAEYAESEQRIGVTKECWFLAEIPTGPHLIAYMESQDFNTTFGSFSQSRDDFDMWFKHHLNEVTGLDMNNPPPDMTLPQLLSHYEAS